MEAILSPYRIEFVDATRTISFNGTDMLRAEVLRPPLPGPNTTPFTNVVRIFLMGDAATAFGPYYDVNLTPGIITNQPSWIDKRSGAQACLEDIAPIIRAVPQGPFPLVKDSVVYDGGYIHLDGDEPSPGPDKHYATDSAGVRGWYDVGDSGGVEDVTADAPISSSGGPTPNITHDDSTVTPGSYTYSSVTVDSKGHVTAAASGTPPVTAVNVTAPIQSTGGATPTISHATTAVTPGSYTSANITVNATGHITAASNGSGGGSVTDVTATSPLSSSGGATPDISHDPSGASAGVYINPTVTVNSTGHITAIADGPTPSGALLPGIYTTAFQTGQGSYDLNAVYGLDGINGSMKLGELYTLANSSTKFAKTYQWYVTSGLYDDTWFENLYHGNACHLEAVLQGNINTPIGTARIGSNNTLYWPKGIYLHNFFSIFDSNKVYGRGVEGAYIGADNTVMAIDLDGWQGENVFTEDGTTPARGIFFPSTYLNDTALGYVQGGFIHNFRFEGGSGWSWYNPDTEDSAITVWDAGECFRIGTVHCVGWNGYGIKQIRGTPGYLDEASTFTCALAGVGFIGSDLSTHRINVLSGDDCPSLLRVRAGFNRPGGGAISIGLIKSESGKRVPIRGQIILDAATPEDTDGMYLNLTIQNIWMAVDYDYTDAAFVIRGFSSSGDPGSGNARISVGGWRGYNYSTVVQDCFNELRWPNPGSFQNYSFTWNCRTGGHLSSPDADDLTWTPSAVALQERFGLLIGGVGSYNYAAGTPTYSITGGTSTPPTPTRTQVFAGAVPSIFPDSDTAQAYHRVIDQEFQPMPAEGVSWSIQSGPATISVGGLITPTGGAGTVVVRAFCTSIFIDFSISITA